MAEFWVSTGAVWRDMLLAEALVVCLFVLSQIVEFSVVLQEHSCWSLYVLKSVCLCVCVSHSRFLSCVVSHSDSIIFSCHAKTSCLLVYLAC